jgi:hypothetical protein
LPADKISGNQVGIRLLAPEHLRLGTWDLLCAWSQSGGQTLWPRMALHLVHEAAFCVNGLRNQRSLTQMSRCPLLVEFPAFALEGDSTDKEHLALPLICGMPPLIGGQSVTPFLFFFFLTVTWTTKPIFMPLRHLNGN